MSNFVYYYKLVTLLVLLIIFGTPNVWSDGPYLNGQILVATTRMNDPRFIQTIIYMIKHNKEGAMGLVINRPLASGPITDLLKSFGLESNNASGEITIHYGGPVQQSKVFVLHSSEYAVAGTIALQGGVALTGNPEVLQAIANDNGPSQNLLIVGYAGWGPDQLEGEIKANHWFTIPAEKELIFDKQTETKWEKARAKQKIAL